jgi:hypothetical protein
MSYISANDYAEIKKFTLDELKDNIDDVKQARDGAILCSQDAQGERLMFILDSIKEYSAWIIAYENELMIRLAITTPPMSPVCHGCREGVLNQMGHYGGCIPDPEIQDILDAICN